MSFNDIQFAQDDARVLTDKLKDLYEAVRRAGGEPGYRLPLASPERLIQLPQAAILAQVNHDIDYAGKSSLLYFADENTVEHIGYLYGERGARMSASFALTTLRYTLSVEGTVMTVIPRGSRVTPDNKVFFATLRVLEIPPGELYGDVEAVCLISGVEGDGFAAGEIKNMVDLEPFVSAVENLTPSTGGAEAEGLEQYKARLRILPESFSVAGPDGGYEFWARSANPVIVDAKAWMPELDLEDFGKFLLPFGITDVKEFYEELFNYFRKSGTGPGNVNVTVLMQNGELPSDEILAQVQETLSPKTRRPLTDFVHTVKPEPVEFKVEFSFWIEIERATEAVSIIESVNRAVDRYILWQQSKLGLDIVPDMLHKLVMDCGVKRLEIKYPEFMVLEPNEVAQLAEEKKVIYEGLEEA